MARQPIRLSAQNLITFTDREQALFNELRRVVEVTQCNTTLRVAGGWVRDKLLSRESGDIDITLDNMMGEQFARLVKDHVQDTSGVGTIKANPEASKHLETACVRVMGIEIDLVNLRAENYTETSRIPEIRIGTPEEDALRRDLTINSLFYNLQEDLIEDFTGLGLEDLKASIARTPLPPLETFLDDPLRVLRTIRFAARFGLTIVDEIHQALADQQVVEALHSKVSRERIGKEYILIMKGHNPERALHIIGNSGLLEAVFKLPPGVPNGLAEGFAVAQRCAVQPEGLTNYYLYTAAVLSSYVNQLTVPTGKRKPVPVFEYVCMESLKTTSSDCKAISGILRNLPEAAEVLVSKDLNKLAFIIRNAQEQWKLCFLLAQVWGLLPEALLEETLEVIRENSLEEFHREKPLLNVRTSQGGDVRTLFKCNGPAIGKVLDFCLHWQATHRTGTKDELIRDIEQSLDSIIG